MALGLGVALGGDGFAGGALTPGSTSMRSSGDRSWICSSDRSMRLRSSSKRSAALGSPSSYLDCFSARESPLEILPAATLNPSNSLYSGDPLPNTSRTPWATPSSSAWISSLLKGTILGSMFFNSSRIARSSSLPCFPVIPAMTCPLLKRGCLGSNCYFNTRWLYVGISTRYPVPSTQEPVLRSQKDVISLPTVFYWILGTGYWLLFYLTACPLKKV